MLVVELIVAPRQNTPKIHHQIARKKLKTSKISKPGACDEK